jgi:hypothetical protein
LVDEPWTLPPRDTWLGAVVAHAFRARGLAPPQAAFDAYVADAHGAMALITVSNRTLSPLAGVFIKTTRSVAKPLATTR